VRLVLVRHGESTWNVEGRYQGRLDPPLSARGQAQAETLAKRLQREQLEAQKQRIDTIVSSPLTRALETANICARELSLPVRRDDRLTEISHGEWEGRLREEIANRWPEMFTAWRTHPDTVRFPAGETLDDVRARFESFLMDLRGASGVLAATHDVIVRIAVLLAQGKPLSAFNDVRVDNAALNEFSFEAGRLAIARLNDTTHLGSLRSDALTQAL
jgi:broad specificity phosphatase PhoE